MNKKTNNKENKPYNYTHDQLNAAIEEVKSGTNSSRASLEFDVPF